MTTYQNYINGQFIDAADTHDVINPSTGQVLAHAPSSDIAAVNEAVAAAKAAQGISPPLLRNSGTTLTALLTTLLKSREKFRLLRKWRCPSPPITSTTWLAGRAGLKEKLFPRTDQAK